MSNRNKSNYFTVKDLKPLIKNIDYLFLLGERANGKSYSVKSYCLNEAFKSIKNGKCEKEIAYIRRYDIDCKDSVLEPYFADMPISEITNNQYTCVSVYRKKIYFAHVDDDGKVKRDICIGYCFAVSNGEHYKSLMYPYIYNVIYEEVVSEKGQYLYLEPSKFQQLISTILRDRKGKVFLVGNTLSRMCPYYNEFGLKDVEFLELGEGRMYTVDNTKIRVFRCKSRNYNSGMFFGNASRNITKGEYFTETQPHLPKQLKDYDIVYRCVLKYENFMYLMYFLKDKITRDMTWYVAPKTTPIQDKTRVIALEYNSSVLWTNGFLALSNNEQTAFNYLLKHHKVVFSDNLTGTEFSNILKHFK